MDERSTKKTKVSCESDDEEETRVWMDADARSIECGICFMPFEAEVFVCNNGHAACAKCCLRINRKCWICEESIGDVRSRALQNVFAEMNTACKFSKYGCGEVIKYVEKRRHEETCPCAPYGCPVSGCSYLGTNVCKHFLADHEDQGEVTDVAYLQATTVTLHKTAPFRMLVQERALDAGERRVDVFLLLNGGGVLEGRSLSLVRIGPHREGNVEIKYKMEVHGSEPGVLSLAGTVRCIRLLEGYEAKKFIFVADADWGPSGSVSVSIRIG